MTVIAHIKNIIIETLFCIPVVLLIDFIFDKIFDKIEERHNKKIERKMDKGKNERTK